MKSLLILLLCCLLILSGCGARPEAELSEPTPSLPAEPAATEGVADETMLYAVSVPAVTEVFQSEDGVELFSYTAQHMQLIIPDEEIADRIVLDFLNRVDAAAQNAESVMEAARNDYVPSEEWFAYNYQLLYSPTRIDRDVLSLWGSQSSYSGGLHGSTSCVAVNYDLTTGDRLTLGSIMHMDAVIEDFITRIIEKLNPLAEEYYLFDDFEDGVYARLSGDENLYEDFYFTQTGLCFFFSPYEIAPYTSGAISVEIPYSELTGLIYDGYFPAEREQVSGTMQADSFMKTDMTRFDNMAEVTLVTGEEISVVYPDGKVEDIRIRISGDDRYCPEYTVFAALEMSDRDAVVISLAKKDMDGVFVSFAADGTVSEIQLS